MANFGAVRYLLFDLQDGVVEADLTIEDQAVSHSEMALCALVDTCLGEHARMDPSVDGRVVLDGDEEWYVFAEAVAREDERQISDATAGLGGDTATEDRAATDGAVAGDLDRVAEGIDRYTGADLGARCDEGLWTDHSNSVYSVPPPRAL